MKAAKLIQMQRVLHAASFYALTVVALGAILYTVGCALGLAPWIAVPIQVGDTPINATAPQIAITVILTALVFFLPANGRIMALERSHRSFRLSMNDVTRAYVAAHAADRDGMFTLSSEFDAVRERLAFMRDHPDLHRLEPEVLELAGQMSQVSHELADVYSAEKVERARTFLRQRQQEVEHLQDQILQAQHNCTELKTWRDQIDADEAGAERALARLEEDLRETLPPLGLRVISTERRSGPVAAQ